MRMLRVLLAGAIVVLGGCASSPEDNRFDDEVTALREMVATLQAEALPTPVEAPAEIELPEVEVFDVVANEVPLPVFLMGLVEGTDYNMVVHPDVQGLVSLELKRVKLAQVLGVVRDTFSLHIESSNHIIRVLPNQLQTRLFTLDYVNLERAGVSEMQVSAGSIKESGGNNNNNQGNNNQGNNNQGNNNQRNNGGGNSNGSSEVVGSRVTTENKVELWSKLEAAVRSLIGPGEGRNVVVMEQAGVIVVTAMYSELASVEQFLALSENALHRQVILEAKILEVTLNEQFQSGINWTDLAQVNGSDGGPVAISLGGVPLANQDGLGGVFGVGVDFKDFSGFIELLETQGMVKVLSSPRISTVNNQKAVIKVGTDEFYVTNVSSTTTTGTSTTTTPSVTLTPFFSGIALDVTPQISMNGDVILHIHPTVSEVSDQNKVVTIGNDTVTLPLALSTIRESDSIVRAKNNQVIVIGGLMKSSGRESNAGAPGLRKVPGLGYGFSQRRQQSSRSELVILVRPVVSTVDTQQSQLESSLERLMELKL